MKKVIVTGGAGFIGSNIVDRLLLDGYEVVVVDNLSSGFKEYIPEHKNCSFINIDILDLHKVYGKLEGASVVFHTAAQSRIQPAIIDPSLAHRNNVMGVYSVLEMMRACGVNKIIFSSSSSIYGLKNYCPQHESMPADCLNPYSVSKYIGEQYIKTWCKLYDLEGACLRYFNVWGPREVIHLLDVAPIVGLFFRKILKENKPLTIIGDGDQRRDFSHISDVVEANIAAMLCEEKMRGEVFNIGTGKNYSILELANIILDCLGLDKSYKEFLPSRPAESRETRADNRKAKAWFGWEPKVVLEQQIFKHRDYYKNKWGV